MNTQTHVLIGWLATKVAANRALGKRIDLTPVWVAAIVAAIVPDVWMIGMLAVEWAAGSSMEYIWNQAYFSEPWRTVDAIFNSIPLYVSVLLLGVVLRWPWMWAFGLSAALHCLLDLPVHASDAHPHFWPISDWKFVSPISYWESDKGAIWVLGLETIMSVLAGIWMWRQFPSIGWRVVLGLILTFVLLFAVMGVRFYLYGAPWD